MIRTTIAAAALALTAAATPGNAQYYDNGYNNSMQRQYGTYNTYQPSYNYNYGYSRYGYGYRQPSYNNYSYQGYGYRRYGYRRCDSYGNCY